MKKAVETIVVITKSVISYIIGFTISSWIMRVIFRQKS